MVTAQVAKSRNRLTEGLKFESFKLHNFDNKRNPVLLRTARLLYGMIKMSIVKTYFIRDRSGLEESWIA